MEIESEKLLRPRNYDMRNRGHSLSSISTIDDSIVEPNLHLLIKGIAIKMHSMMNDSDQNKVDVTQIFEFIYYVFRTAQCAQDTLLISLIYCERLLENNKEIDLTERNWKSISTIALLLASKVWDDSSMQNNDFACFLPFTINQINEWERYFLHGIKFDVSIKPSQYTCRFFDIRELTSSLGTDSNFCNENLKNQDTFPRNRANSTSNYSVSPTSSVSTWCTDLSPMVL